MTSPVMSTEERLRAATRAAAATVAPGSAPPLRLPGDPAGEVHGRWRLRRRWLRAPTPLAAAAAVAAVVIASLYPDQERALRRRAAGRGEPGSGPRR